MTTCPYCGVETDSAPEHHQDRHGITPEQHAANQRKARIPGATVGALLDNPQKVKDLIEARRRQTDGYL